MQNVEPLDRARQRLELLKQDLADIRAEASRGERQAVDDALALLRLVEKQLSLGVTHRGKKSQPVPARLGTFADLLRQRRDASGLTQADLVRLTGLSISTVKGLEAGRQVPSRTTLLQLLSVRELGLRTEELQTGRSAQPWQPNCYLPPRYDPVQLAMDMLVVVNGPGGHLDQSHLYLDSQSAADWLAICESEMYVGIRSALFAELEHCARFIAADVGNCAITVNAIGPGDGKSEVCFTQHLVQHLRHAEIKLHLLDISHNLLSRACEHAVKVVGARVPIVAIHGSFHELTRFPMLVEHDNSRLVFTLLGSTLANLADEVRFFRDLHMGTAPGDFAVIDFQLTATSDRSPKAIREAEPILVAGAPSQTMATWMQGPLQRYNRTARSIKVRTGLTTACLVPGSYQIDCIADCELEGGATRQFQVWRAKRYDVDLFSETLASLGWQTVMIRKYGAKKNVAVMVLRRV